jgi:hypothetical protein
VSTDPKDLTERSFAAPANRGAAPADPPRK